MASPQTQSTTGDFIQSQLGIKVNYLNDLSSAIDQHQDRKVYQLLNQSRFDHEVLGKELTPNHPSTVDLVDNLHDELSNFLSINLIDYLGKAYPFFYYQEYTKGHFRIFFGNWWDRREFGELDVVNVKFDFDEEEYTKLAQAVDLARENKRYNSEKINELSEENEHLQALLDSEEERESKRAQLEDDLREASSRSGIFESKESRESREAIVQQISQLDEEQQATHNALDNIKRNEKIILDLSKENTILSYEQKSINDVFGSFNDFEKANDQLYVAYLNHLAKTKVGENHE